ncbi:uncharacterized protein LOC136036869 isoform X1 [Artemia franciscana]|uniref:uncharacterized protein LOC136036869 isoform X1 n=1 Tax=Artemia franciscana TaxID=6661 RepID=UPI0032DA23B2
MFSSVAIHLFIFSVLLSPRSCSILSSAVDYLVENPDTTEGIARLASRENLEEVGRFFYFYGATNGSSIAPTVTPSYALIIVLGISAILLAFLGLLYILAAKAISEGGRTGRALAPSTSFEILGNSRNSLDRHNLEWTKIIESLMSLNDIFNTMGISDHGRRREVICKASADSKTQRYISSTNNAILETLEKLRLVLPYLDTKNEFVKEGALHKLSRSYVKAMESGQRSLEECREMDKENV